MKKSVLIFLTLAACACSAEKTIEPVDFSKVLIEDGFWAPRLDLHKTATIPICIDQIEKETGRMRNFEKAAAGEGEHEGYFFDDSDVYKALEGLAYSSSIPTRSWRPSATSGLPRLPARSRKTATSTPSSPCPAP